MNFIGRKEELEELNARFRSGRFEMGIVYGSRRIGKTSLLRKFVEDKASFYFQAKESNELDNRTAFSNEINKLIGIPYAFIYPTYQRKGIVFVAAAIGDDKVSIERIYGDSFLDITDLRQLPMKLTGVVGKHIQV